MSYASAASGGGGGAGADIDMSNMPRSAEEQRQRQEAAAQREEQIEQMLRQMCSPAALDRLKRVQLVRKDRADHVKRMLIQMAQRGQIKEKVSESMITDLLEKVGEQTKAASSVSIQRKNMLDDDDDDDDLLDGL